MSDITPQPASPLTLTIARHLTQDVVDYADASEGYTQARDLSGEGGSTFRDGVLTRGDALVGYVSYNGRVWQLVGSMERLMYCPASVGEDEGRPDVFNSGRESVWGRNVPNPHVAGTLEHRVFKRGATAARKAHL